MAKEKKQVCKEVRVDRKGNEFEMIMVPKPQVPSQRESFARANHLLHMSTLCATSGLPEALSRAYTKNMIQVTQKAVLKVSPHVKRGVCKKCHTRLIPGISSIVRLENKSNKKYGEGREKSDVVVIKCKNCENAKRYPIGKDREYVLHSDRTES